MKLCEPTGRIVEVNVGEETRERVAHQVGEPRGRLIQVNNCMRANLRVHDDLEGVIGMGTPRACHGTPRAGLNNGTKVLVGLLTGRAVDSSASRSAPRGRLMFEREFRIAMITPFIGIESRCGATLCAPAVDL